MSASRLAKNTFQWLLPCFRGQFNGAIGNTVRCYRKSEIQDGGSKNVSTYSSAHAQDSNEISKAKHMFSGSGNMAELERTLYNLKINGKSKMAVINWT